MDILLATTNPGKLREFAQLLADLPVQIKSPTDLGIDLDVEETGSTFEENAAQKASAWAKATNMVCVADDSGLCVDALEGNPGIYSARWSEKHNITAANRDQANLELVVTQLAEHTNRSARYVAVAALAHPDGTVQLARGELEGTIINTPRGENGFGYDPIFIPNGYTQTAAELPAEEKNRISHRAKAMAEIKQLISQLV